MKTLLLLLSLFTGLASPAAAAGLAAKDALRTLARERGASWLERIVQVGGDKGTDQPLAWHIVATGDGGGLQEFFIGKKGIISEGRVPASAAASFSGSPIAQKKWVYDSTIAFVRAEAIAKKQQLGFDFANFRLRNSQSAPLWSLQLSNAAGQKVAEVTVSAASGKVVNFTTYNPAPPPPPAPPPSNSQQTLDRTKEAINKTVQGMGRGLNKAGSWIQRKFSPNPPPTPYYEPTPMPRGSAQ